MEYYYKPIDGRDVDDLKQIRKHDDIMNMCMALKGNGVDVVYMTKVAKTVIEIFGDESASTDKAMTDKGMVESMRKRKAKVEEIFHMFMKDERKGKKKRYQALKNIIDQETFRMKKNHCSNNMGETYVSLSLC